MCGRHHDVIDDDEEAYPVERLHQLKDKHEQNTGELPEEQAERGASALILNAHTLISQPGGFSANVMNFNQYNSSPHAQVSAQPVSIVEKDSQMRDAAEALPTLKINRRTEQVVFDYFRSSWRLALPSEPESRAAAVLWVENDFPTQGSARDLHGLIASIRAEQYDSLTVSRAYWLGHPGNEVTIPSGDKRGILVGYFEDNRFISYHNPHGLSDFDNILSDGSRYIGEKIALDLIVGNSNPAPLRIKVVIAQMPLQAVVSCKQLVITLPYKIVDLQDCE
jgi:hypothetical protein